MSDTQPTPAPAVVPVGPLPPPPSWRNAIPSSFNDLVAALGGIALLGVVCLLAVDRVEAAIQTVVSAFMLWIGWAIRGRVEQAKNEARPPEPKP